MIDTIPDMATFNRLLDMHLKELKRLEIRLATHEAKYKETNCWTDGDMALAFAQQLGEEREYGRYLRERQPKT